MNVKSRLSTGLRHNPRHSRPAEHPPGFANAGCFSNAISAKVPNLLNRLAPEHGCGFSTESPGPSRPVSLWDPRAASHRASYQEHTDIRPHNPSSPTPAPASQVPASVRREMRWPDRFRFPHCGDDFWVNMRSRIGSRGDATRLGGIGELIEPRCGHL
jgi:hypothetical protein